MSLYNNCSWYCGYFNFVIYKCHYKQRMRTTMANLETNNVIRYIIDDRYRLLRHVSFLLGLLILFYSSNFTHEFSGVYKYYFLFSVWTIFIVMFYVNMYVLVPVFFFRSRYLLYFLLLLGLVFLCLSFTSYLGDTYFDAHKINGNALEFRRVRGLFDGIIISIPIILLTTTVKLFQMWLKDRERISDLKNLTLTMELNELKNQINPHFLFNMLNNVKALIRKDPIKATEVLLKLSDFLRYQLYENNDEKTSLLSEIAFIHNFLNLEEIRRDKFTIKLSYDQPALTGILLPPNLFTTFIENAVKHSTDNDGKETYIEISIKLSDTGIHFTCVNSFSPDSTDINREYGGLGLNNIKRRLDLLYQDNYVLDIIPEDDRYTINLIIPYDDLYNSRR